MTTDRHFIINVICEGGTQYGVIAEAMGTNGKMFSVSRQIGEPMKFGGRYEAIRVINWFRKMGSAFVYEIEEVID